jgi:hypothetical protein
LQVAASCLVVALRDGATFDRGLFDTGEADLHQQLEQYLALPFYPGERTYYSDVDGRMLQFEQQLSVLVDRLHAGDREAAERLVTDGFSAACANLDDALGRLVFFNAEQ